jgi:AcrR family transcriptional regulator
MEKMTSPQRRRPGTPGSAARLTRAERKRQLLGHAKQLFAAQGLQTTTLDQIAASAGVTPTVLARHFDTKNSIFAVLMEEIRAVTLQRWDADTLLVTDPLAKLHALADMYLEAMREHALEFRIMHRTLVEAPDEGIIDLLRSFYLDSEAFLARIIAEGQQTGVFRRPLDPRVGAWELIRTVLGYTLTLPLGIPLFAEDNYLPQAIDCLLHSLLKTDV